MDKNPESRFSYLVGIVVNLILLYAVNKAPDWNIVFLTDAYAQIRPVLVTAVLVQIVGNVVMLALYTAVVHYVMEVVFSFVSAFAVYRLIVVFPFDFAALGAPAVNTILKILLVVGLVFTLVGLISNVYKLMLVVRSRHFGPDDDKSGDEEG